MSSNHSSRREVPNKDASGTGRKDSAKSLKKPGKSFLLYYLGLSAPVIVYGYISWFLWICTDKSKTAKEEARELQLKEEDHIRKKVMSIQENVSSMLKALGDMAIANPIFTHSQLPSSVSLIVVIFFYMAFNIDYSTISCKLLPV